MDTIKQPVAQPQQNRLHVPMPGSRKVQYFWSPSAMSILAVALISPLAVGSPPSENLPLGTQEAKLQEKVTVFKNGSHGYNIFRIPAIIQAADGSLLAFCEAREGGDASTIDLVSKRSDDGGASWGALQIVQSHEAFAELYQDPNRPITVGNPAPVVDRIGPDTAGRIWLPFTVENDRVFVCYSDDHGQSWSEPQEITQSVKRPEWGWYATGPVHSIQIQQGKHRGRLVIPCDHRLGDDGADRGANGAQVILSDDFGVTWRLGAVDDSYEDGLNANETTVVELPDGRLYFNTRDQHGSAPGTRGSAYSSDGGDSFDAVLDGEYRPFVPSPKLLDPPVVQCSLLRVDTGESKGQSSLILFCGPETNGPHGPGRSDLRLRFSADETQSWQDGPLIHVGPAAYSDMVQLKTGTLGILFECGSTQDGTYNRIDFTTIETTALEAN